jgi:LysM repeat protein
MEAPPGSRLRLLAPAALIAFALLFLMVVAGSLVCGSGSSQSTDQGESGEPGERGRTRRGAATYRVRPGDTLGSISERTGRTPEELQSLNPDLDAQALQPGQRLKLRE